MKKTWTMAVLLPLVVLSGCLTLRQGSSRTRSDTVSLPGTPAGDLSLDSIAAAARRYARAATPGGRVLRAAILLVEREDIIIGGCWDFVDAVYKKAELPADKRTTIYRAPETGPFADPGLCQPGDWVMYRNLPYGEIGHSAIFVEWIDFEKRSALTIEYVGRNRTIPGRYREADLTKTWGILRGAE